MAKRKIADPDYSSSHVDNLQKSQVSEKKKEHRFHIIVASCNRRSQAEMVKSKLNQNNKNSAIVLESNGKFRVSLQSFTNKTLAEEELNRQRKRLKKPEIWLLAE